MIALSHLVMKIPTRPAFFKGCWCQNAFNKCHLPYIEGDPSLPMTISSFVGQQMDNGVAPSPYLLSLNAIKNIDFGSLVLLKLYLM